MNPSNKLRQWARSLKRDVIALYLAARDPRVPYHAKIVAAGVTAYALSPIDLIPDFIPVVGYLDDVILVPLGILLAIKLILADVMVQLRSEAEEFSASRPISRTAAVVIVLIWLASGAAIAWWPIGLWRR